MEAYRRAKTEKSISSSVKCIFFDCNVVVRHDHLPQGRTVYREYYRLCEAIRQKRAELQKNYTFILHHDNSPAHTSMLVRECLAKNKTLITPQLSHSPDFPKLKTPVKGKRFTAIEKIKEKSSSCWRYQAHFRSVSTIGKNANISVLYLKGEELL